jgi:hypothetical protein
VVEKQSQNKKQKTKEGKGRRGRPVNQWMVGSYSHFLFLLSLSLFSSHFLFSPLPLLSIQSDSEEESN